MQHELGILVCAWRTFPRKETISLEDSPSRHLLLLLLYQHKILTYSYVAVNWKAHNLRLKAVPVLRDFKNILIAFQLTA